MISTKYSLNASNSLFFAMFSIISPIFSDKYSSNSSYSLFSNILIENVLEEFKTTSDDDTELKQEVEAAAIANIISPELQAQLEQDFGGSGATSGEIDFDPDSIELY